MSPKNMMLKIIALYGAIISIPTFLTNINENHSKYIKNRVDH